MIEKWMIYPVVVGVMVLWSANWGLKSGSGVWEKLVETRSSTQQEMEAAAIVRQKLVVLEDANRGQLAEDLQLVVEAVPTTAKAWLLIGQLRRAGMEAAGAMLESYKGGGGEAKEATAAAEVQPEEKQSLVLEAQYAVADLQQAGQVVAGLEKVLPLAKVVRAEYAPGSLRLTVEGAWVSWSKIPAGAETLALPDYEKVTGEAKGKLENFVRMVELGGGMDVLPVGGVSNPF